jgi:putative ABC transport system permease protein
VNKLQRKLVRDLAASKGLILAVAVVIFLGVALFGASFMGYQNLKGSYDYSYERLRFADFTVKVVEAPSDAVEELEAIPGVEAVTGRVNTDMALKLPGEDGKRVEARVISLPSGERAAVNDVKVEEGSYLQGDDGNVLLVEKSFAKHHELNPGDTVSLIVDGQEISFQIAGIVTSPEYIWAAKSRQEILTSPETFGVVFVSQETVSELVDKPSINEFCFLIDEGTDRDIIIAQVEDELASYGVMEVVTQEEQPSYAALEQDLEGFGAMAAAFPLLFLSVGALATYILLTRIVHNQRAQIGLMRAVGYSRRQVLVHYLSFALVIGVVGALSGAVVGYLLSEAITNFYIGFLGLPFTKIEMQWLAVAEGIFIGILPCIIAGILPAYSASRIRPAEAMRTPPPATGRKILLERLFPFLTRLSSLWKIPLRNIFRNRRRSLYTIIGVTFGVSLILVSAGMMDSVEALIDLQFNDIQRYDAQVTFAQPQPTALVDEVDGWDEVEEAQPVLQIPTRLEHEDKTYTTLVIGLSPDSELYGLHSTGGDEVRVSDEGILLSEGLRNTLDIDRGDVITLRSGFALQQVEVAGFVKQPVGSFGYVTVEQAQQMAGDWEVISGLMLNVKPEYIDTIREKANQIPATASVELTAETKGEIDKWMDLGMAMMWVMLAFGATLALAIVFTTVTVNILERRREIATMRTLGESKTRIAGMITVENLLLGLAGLIPGILLGYGLTLYFFGLMQTDMFSFDLVIFPTTYVLTAGVVILIMLISQLPGIRQVNRLNLAQMTKEQAT